MVALIFVCLIGGISVAIASNKGFKPWRWFWALGLIGLIVVSCLASAKAPDISPCEAIKREEKANKIGAIMAWINVGLSVIILIASFCAAAAA